MSNVRRFGMLLALLVTVALPAQSRDQRSAAVGMRAYVEQLVLPGSELEPAPGDMKSPVVVRVLKVWPHGNQLRYDLEWTGLEAGEYDLTKFLRRKDGAASDDLPKVAVVVTRTLPKQQMEPSEPAPSPAPRLDGYSRWQVIAGITWAVGLLLILFVGRRRRSTAVAPPPPKPTLADRLRPLVEAVAGDRANSAAKAELERLLLAFWRARLDLQQQKAADAILTIKRHPEAGALLRQIEAWLHMPAPPARVDLSGLLAPYRTVTADDFAPLPAPGQTTAGKA
ncbi:MAG: hypothetical protein IT455_15370 [Planctomycetes bacterium]|nr:hypothetical protein [Planctomycetota bacterium]